MNNAITVAWDDYMAACKQCDKLFDNLEALRAMQCALDKAMDAKIDNARTAWQKAGEHVEAARQAYKEAKGQ